MVIEALDGVVISRIRSSSTVDSVTQCVTELVLNSLDAKSTAIAVRIDLQNYRVQVVDNGKGISRDNLEFVGQRYMTSKCHNLTDLQNCLKYYGFKGEALASIIEISQRVSVTSRKENCEDTYCKTVERESCKVELVKIRPSCGTTVTVEGFLSNLPVRQQCVRNNEIDSVKKSLESLIIIHPRVSFSLRNDCTGKLVLDSVKCLDIATSFRNIHPEVDDANFVLFKVSKSKTSVEGLIHKDFHENKRLQYVYVNKRPISCPKIQNLINSSLRKIKPSDAKQSHPVYVLHIKCPYSDIDLSLEPSKTVVFFKKFDIIQKCIEKMMGTFLGEGNTQDCAKKKRGNDEKSEYGLSQIDGAVKGVGLKRKSEELEEFVASKSPKITEDTPLFEEPKLPTNMQTNMSECEEIERQGKMERMDRNFEVTKENSLYTNFPDNERKGKDIIMDMFIKSVQVFPSENKTLESLRQSPVHMEEQEEIENDSFKPSDKVTLGIQTTQKEFSQSKEKMVSVGVQAGPSKMNSLEYFGNVALFPRKSLKKFVSDYDFDFSKVETFPTVKADNKFAADLTNFSNFNQTRKVFDFRNVHSRKMNIFSGFDQDSIPYFDREKENLAFLDEVVLTPVPKERVDEHLPKKSTTFGRKFPQNVCHSQYFPKQSQNKINFLSRRQRSQEHVKNIKPNSLSQTNRQYVEEKRRNTQKSSQNLPPTLTTPEKPEDKDLWKAFPGKKKSNHLTCSKRNRARKKLNESTISSYFTPLKKPSQSKKRSQNIVPEDDSDYSKDLFVFTKSSKEDNKGDSSVIITVDEGEKQNSVDRDTAYEKQLKHDILPTFIDSQNDWSKEENRFGTTLYTNKKTGMKSLNCPKKDIVFEMAERFEFVPKGLSPILKDYGNVESLTPNARENLQNAVIQSYEDELLLVKWQNCIHDKDPKKFFEEIYAEKSKLIESEIPNVTLGRHEIFENMSFTKEVFQNFELIGQVDRKFIVVLEKTKNLVILFDQHAVHERVRLEQLLEVYKNSFSKISQNIMIFLPQNDLILIRNQEAHIKALGLGFDIYADGINIYQVPLCLYKKSKKGADLSVLIETLIKEIVETLKTNNEILVNTPKLIQNIINSEACRGAIKFGDSLTKTECLIYLKQLSDCNLPFQCAHGRPTITPLITLNKIHDLVVTKPCLSRLK